MGRVAGVFDNPPGFPCTPPGVDILEGGKLTSNNTGNVEQSDLSVNVAERWSSLEKELICVGFCYGKNYKY